jgi:hypothetical protein
LILSWLGLPFGCAWYFFFTSALQNAVDRLSKYVGTLEEKMEALERKKR